MEITLEKDILVFYIEASSFPAGIAAAHQQLHAIVPFSPSRNYYGISRPEGAAIAYKAAAEETFPGEGELYRCPTLILRKGKYISETVRDYPSDPRSMEHAFRRLLSHPGLDPQGYCVERYMGDKDVQCMVRLER